MHLQNPCDILEVRDGASMCLPSLTTHCNWEAVQHRDIKHKKFKTGTTDSWNKMLQAQKVMSIWLISSLCNVLPWTSNSVWSKYFPLSLRQGAPSYLPKFPGLGCLSTFFIPNLFSLRWAWWAWWASASMYAVLGKPLYAVLVPMSAEGPNGSSLLFTRGRRLLTVRVFKPFSLFVKSVPRLFDTEKPGTLWALRLQLDVEAGHTSYAIGTLLGFTHSGSDQPEAAEDQLDFAQTAQSWGPWWRISSW